MFARSPSKKDRMAPASWSKGRASGMWAGVGETRFRVGPNTLFDAAAMTRYQSTSRATMSGIWSGATHSLAYRRIRSWNRYWPNAVSVSSCTWNGLSLPCSCV
ncbi:hypothetical protein ACFQ1S_11710 [Kibdelosporangium lantanae]|uniref:Uncharacterized protein n=1 Tax=Kibdelosporangium lantanae TaxID=1497396 RepID=A0ABW3M652_9PSEU